MPDEIGEQIEALTGAIRELGRTRNEANPTAKAADGGRYAAALDGSKEIADQLVALNRNMEATHQADARKARDAEIAEAVKKALADTRSPSLAAVIGQGPRSTDSERSSGWPLASSAGNTGTGTPLMSAMTRKMLRI